MALGYQVRCLVHGLGQDVVLLGVHAGFERLHVEGDVVDPAVVRVGVVRVVHLDCLAREAAGVQARTRGGVERFRYGVRSDPVASRGGPGPSKRCTG